MDLAIISAFSRELQSLALEKTAGRFERLGYHARRGSKPIGAMKLLDMKHWLKKKAQAFTKPKGRFELPSRDDPDPDPRVTFNTLTGRGMDPAPLMGPMLGRS